MSRPTRKAPAKSRPSNRTGWLQRAVVFVFPSSFFLVAGFRIFTSTGRDDTHMTYWPAYTLAHFGEILNYNGERVEQSSSLLHVILLAVLHKLSRVDVVTLGKLSSILAGVATLLLVHTLVRKIADRAVAFAAAMLAATSAYFVYWSFGGLETTVVSAAGLWIVLAFGNYTTQAATPSRVRAMLPSLLAMTTFALVRPESPLLLIGMLVAAFLISWRRFPASDMDGHTRRGRVLELLGAAAAVCGLVFTFRLLYFDSAFPQPVTAKYSGLSPESFMNGLRYLATSVFSNGPGVAAPLAAAGLACLGLMVAEWRSQRFVAHTVFGLLLVAGSLAFIAFSGGDWMEGGRFLVPFLPVALAFVPVALAKAIRGERRRQLVVALSTTALVLLGAASMLSFARRESFGTLRWREMEIAQEHDVSAYTWFEKRNRINMRDVPAITFINELIPKIEAHRPGPVIVMTGQMGIVPYHVARKHFGHVRFIDRRGLCDRALTGCELLRSLSRDTRGLHMEYLDYFKMQNELEERCDVPRPDVIFDLRGGNTQIVAERGYKIIARQFGKVYNTMRSGGEVEATNFVAARMDLWASMEADKFDSTGTAPEH